LGRWVGRCLGGWVFEWSGCGCGCGWMGTLTCMVVDSLPTRSVRAGTPSTCASAWATSAQQPRASASLLATRKQNAQWGPLRSDTGTAIPRSRITRAPRTSLSVDTTCNASAHSNMGRAQAACSERVRMLWNVWIATHARRRASAYEHITASTRLQTLRWQIHTSAQTIAPMSNTPRCHVRSFTLDRVHAKRACWCAWCDQPCVHQNALVHPQPQPKTG
jgi:hypothetical protein